MALNFNYETETGAIATYFRIGAIQINYTQGQQGVQATVFVYLDKEKRDAGKKPIEALNVHLGTDKIDFTQEVTREVVYSAIKTLPEFVGAEDV